MTLLVQRLRLAGWGARRVSLRRGIDVKDRPSTGFFGGELWCKQVSGA